MKETTPGGNKRLSRRRVAKTSIRATLRLGGLDMGPNVGRSLVDLSESGARVTVHAALEPKQEVSLSMEGQSHSRPVVRVGRVIWCRPADEGAFLVGVAFDKRLPYAAFLELTQEPR